jgi:effector-binding domain-containing protein
MAINLEQQPAQMVLYIRKHTSMDKLPTTIGERYMQIMGYLQELGEQPAGVPYTAYHNLDMQDMDVEMGFPVAKQLPPKGDIKAREIAAGSAVSVMYKGPYSAMEATYNEIFKWLAEKGRRAQGVYYEYYFNSPQTVPESELLTKIVIPLVE